MFFFKLFIVDVYVHLAFRSFMVYFCLLVDVVFLCPTFFLLLFLFFFFLILLHSFSFFKKLFPICSWCLTPFYNSFIYSFIYVLPQIHENLIINYRRAILLATFMPGLRQTKGNIFISSLSILIPKLWKPFIIPRELRELTIILKHYD